MSASTLIEVELTFRTISQGGREVLDGILNGSKYRPHIVVGSPAQQHPVVVEGNRLTENYLGIAFVRGPRHVELGQSCVAQASLIYEPAVEYSNVIPGASFTLREGAQIVGHGLVLKRWTELQ